MTNLATRNVTDSEIIYESAKCLHYKQNVIYGCFGKPSAEMKKENVRKMRNAQIKEGIVFGLKLSFCMLLGVVFAQKIFEWQDVRTAVLPAFAVVSMWAACAGSVFCVSGLVRNLICVTFRK